MSTIEKIWSEHGPVNYLLLPISLLFCFMVGLRRWAYRLRLLPSKRFAVPVIVVGNITVGGTGKTPVVIWLAQYLRARGYRPGIVSRGYRGHASHWPQQVRPDSDPWMVGDEAVLIAQRTQCPMCVGPDRQAAVAALLRYSDVNVIISDDGLQHYRLVRDVEIAVIDGERKFGNGLCLPAGPLRESVARLAKVDFKVVTGNGVDQVGNMRLIGETLVNLTAPEVQIPVQSFSQKCVHAIAGIGNPSRFFSALESLGFEVLRHPFPDHHEFCAEEIDFNDGLPVIMTEKDAVKCRKFPREHFWYLPVSAQLPTAFGNQLLALIQAKATHG